jgi:hypothetical protein
VVQANLCFNPSAFDIPGVFMSELRTEWFAVYRAAMVEVDPRKQRTLVEAAHDLMRRRARQVGDDRVSHVEKQLMMDAIARLDQRWNHHAA